MDESLFRRESDRTLGAILAKLDQVERELAEVKAELQDLRDTKNKGLGVLLFAGSTIPVVGAIIWWLAQKAFKL